MKIIMLIVIFSIFFNGCHISNEIVKNHKSRPIYLMGDNL